MRVAIGLVCAVVLAACADAKNPLSPPHKAIALPTPPLSDTALARIGVDARTIPERLEDMLGASVSSVTLPPDGFSGASDAVHPDMVCPPPNWGTTRCWLLYTPYRNSDATYENPAFLAMQSDTTWVTPPQVSNPIVPFPGIGMYNSDPDHAFDPRTRRLVQVYRVVADGYNKIMMMSTANAKTWSQPLLAFRERNHDAVSPSLVIEPDRSGKLWYVRTGVDGCTSKSSTVQLRIAQPDTNTPFETADWSTSVATDLTLPGYVLWHLDVAELPAGGYVALIAAFPRGLTCSYSDLWLAASPDGLHWRMYAMPILWRTMKAARERGIVTWYRGTIRYDAETDSLHVWPSALTGRTWTVYHTGAPLHELLRLLDEAQPSDVRSLMLARPRAVKTSIPMP